MKSSLVSSINHDLRTPLSAIKGYTDLLLDGAYGALSAEQGEATQAIASATQRMIEIVNALLDLRKLEKGRSTLAVGPLDLKQLVSEICAEMSPLAKAKGLILTKKVSQGSFPMTSDKRSLCRILSNLVGNAIKFTERGGVQVSVDSVAASLRGPGNMVQIRVEDTGCGIEARHLERVFDPFYQVDPFGNNATHGNGLGLAICKQLVKLLKGRIKVESKVGRGTAFTTVLPQHADWTTGLSEPRERERAIFPGERRATK